MKADMERFQRSKQQQEQQQQQQALPSSREVRLESAGSLSFSEVHPKPPMSV